MSVNLSIKNVPDRIAERLRERARRSNRSLQGELLTILEEAVGLRPSLTPRQLLAQVRAAGIRTPDEATAWIRGDRDAR